MFKKFISIFLSVCIFASFSLTSFATTRKNTDTITTNSEYYLSAEEIYNGDYFSTEELEAATEDGAIILGGIDAPLSEISASTGNTRGLFERQLWCKSYATYDKDSGVSVNVKVYYPWYYFASPKLTSIEGACSVTLGKNTTTKAFAAFGKEDSSISADIKMGSKASSGTEGKVSVAGWATGTNIMNGYGEFAIAYEITIP